MPGHEITGCGNVHFLLVLMVCGRAALNCFVLIPFSMIIMPPSLMECDEDRT